MEGLSDNGEDDSKKPESPSKKKKRAETLGTFLVDPKLEQAKLPAEDLQQAPERPSQDRSEAREANQLHGKDRTERIGQVLIGAETPRVGHKESLSGTDAVEKQVEGLSRAELLEMSDKIIVEATTLRNIYDTHLIGERGLRRLVSEHLRGGDIKEILKRELLERELDFERDPAMRDRALQDPGAASTVTLNSLLQKADVFSGDLVTEELAVLKARAKFESDQQERRQQHRRWADIALVSTIVILLALVILLLITRHS